ncbi:apolipoprotein N-acyltransferase [Skermanella stibiiresistens SB22]|uniref:Apolipoprotein N-acyltransferase n=1 Tax=Skermanella stibiiresistens SB22 TaxID=1385369 RepID=W9H804_9PROT|nr:apolipoprotein N-acyltransferase [Skermanella stibiiresistens SB22]
MMALTGWRRHLTAALLGGLATFALPPAYAVPVLLLAFPGLLWLLDGAATKRSAFLIGWWFGFGHFLLGLYWISFALLTDIARFWWMMPFAAAGLPALLAIFIGAATLCLHVLARRLALRGLARVLALAMLWTVAEYLRGHVLTGFPWNLIGYSWVGFPPVLQSVAVIGTYGLGLVTVAVAGLPALLGDRSESRRRAMGSIAAGLLLVALIGAAGWVRLSQSDGPTVPGVTLRIVQPNIAQTLKWNPAERARNFERLLELTAEPPAPGAHSSTQLASTQVTPTHVIWPETAVPFFLERDAAARQAIGSVTPSGGAVITGAPRVRTETDGTNRFWNSLHAVDGSGALLASYDKFHLVPFGEYMPLRGILPVASIAAGATDFSAGPGPATLEIPGLPPFSPLICYEVIFPARVKDASRRPDWLLNVTNDAWYGISAGPHQHFAIAQARAAEEGLPLVRAANTGISGVIDGYGRPTAYLELGSRGVVDAALPKALDNTPYGRMGDLILVVLLMSFGVGTTIARQTA